MGSLEGKVVIITGASEGIGACLAASLRRRGARLSLNARNEAKLSRVAGLDDLIFPGDLTEASVPSTLIAKTVERFGRIDILINNAGRGLYYTASTTPLDEARALFELNLFAPLELTQLATPHLRQTRGIVVNVASIAGHVSLPWLPVYSASKFALAAMTSAQRTELRRAGVHVMGVFPGYVNTEFQMHAAGPMPPERVLQGKRFAISPEECAEATVHGILQRKRTVVAPRKGWLLIWANWLFPSFVEAQLERALNG